MRFVKFCSLLIFPFLICTSYAQENSRILVGQNAEHTVFILEISPDGLDNAFFMNENGEIYLKADKIVSLPKEAMPSFYTNSDTANDLTGLSSVQVNMVTCNKCRRQYDKDNQSRNCPHGWNVLRP